MDSHGALSSESLEAQAADVPREQIQRQTEDMPTSTPVEMKSLESPPPVDQSAIPNTSEPSAPAQTPESAAPETDPATNTGTTMQSAPVNTNAAASTARVQPQEDPLLNPPATLQRQESSAIGPSSDTPTITVDPMAGPAVMITLLLVSGARHPYKIDESYLRRRNVVTSIADVDPYAISVYTMKELIWRDWREEWEARPLSPSSIRLIHFGKLLDDKSSLREHFKTETPNVVHMSVKPQELVDEDDNAKTSHNLQHDENDRNAGCCGRCVIL